MLLAIWAAAGSMLMAIVRMGMQSPPEQQHITAAKLQADALPHGQADLGFHMAKGQAFEQQNLGRQLAAQPGNDGLHIKTLVVCR